jgi:hypothetical protein
MAGELVEPFPTEQPAITVPEIEVADREGGNGRIAILLTVAAVVAAVIGARAAMISSEAGDQWQSSLRTTEKRDAGIMNNVQTLYQNELPLALQILEARLLADELTVAAAGLSGDVQRAVKVEAATESLVAAGLPLTDLAGTPYTLPSGGFDLGKRMADLQAKSGLSDLDPDSLEASGDQLAHRAVLLTYALLPTSFGALLGVLAQPLRRYRRHLLSGGTAFVVAGMVVALGVEVLA